MYKLIRTNPCLLCTDGKVVESVEEVLYTGDIPDCGNCDFSEYQNYSISGGKLLVKVAALTSITYTQQYPAVCSRCLRGKKVSALVELLCKH